MTKGKHITESECRRMKEMFADTLIDDIADRFGVTNIAVSYHINGHCSHDSGEKKRRTRSQNKTSGR